MLKSALRTGVRAPLGTQVMVSALPETRELPGTAGAGPPHVRGGTDRDEICCLGLGLPRMGVTFTKTRKKKAQFLGEPAPCSTCGFVQSWVGKRRTWDARTGAAGCRNRHVG